MRTEAVLRSISETAPLSHLCKAVFYATPVYICGFIYRTEVSDHAAHMASPPCMSRHQARNNFAISPRLLVRTSAGHLDAYIIVLTCPLSTFPRSLVPLFGPPEQNIRSHDSPTCGSCSSTKDGCDAFSIYEAIDR